MLVTKIEEVKRYYPNTTFDKFEKLKAYMNNAEQTYLLPVLGYPLYETMDALYENMGVDMDGKDYKTLLAHVQRAIVLFGMYEAFPSLNVTINQSGGMTVTTNDNTVAASRDRYTTLSDATSRQAWDAIDFLLMHLERNSKIFLDDNDQELWKQSEWFWQQTGLLIFTAKEFEEAGVYIEGRRRRFIQLLPSMRLMERQYIRSVVGNKTVDDLIRRKMSATLTDADREVLPLLQSALALYVKTYDPELNKPESTHGENSRASALQAAGQLNLATALMKGNATDYPDYPENIPNKKLVEYIRSEQGDPFFLLSGVSARGKHTP